MDQKKKKVFHATTAIIEGYGVVNILSTLPEDSQGISFSQIIKQMGLNPNTLTKQLWGLMEEGIVERKIVSPDEKRRYSFYKLTKPGKAFFEKLKQVEALPEQMRTES